MEKLCHDCSAPIQVKSRCPSCLEKNAKARSRLKSKRLEDSCCIKCGTKTRGKYCNTCRTKIKQWCQHDQQTTTKLVYAHYGNKCACCGESESMFLSIDHIDGGGRVDRKKLGGSTYMLQRHLIKQNFPSGYQLLCMNCNYGRYRNGGLCPHFDNERLVCNN